MRLVPAERSHIPLIAMRDADKRECGAFGHSPGAALENALRGSLWALTAMAGDEPVAMLGVTPLSMVEGVGVPWMLGSDRIYDSSRALIRLVPPVIAEMHETFPQLENYVSTDNARAMAFLRHFDFELSGDVRIVGGVPFQRFTRCAIPSLA